MSWLIIITLYWSKITVTRACRRRKKVRGSKSNLIILCSLASNIFPYLIYAKFILIWYSGLYYFISRSVNWRLQLPNKILNICPSEAFMIFQGNENQCSGNKIIQNLCPTINCKINWMLFMDLKVLEISYFLFYFKKSFFLFFMHAAKCNQIHCLVYY